MSSLNFNNDPEPDNFLFEFKQDLKELLKNDGIDYIDIKTENKEDFIRMLTNLTDMTNDIKIYGISNQNYTLRLEGVEELDKDEPSEEKVEDVEDGSLSIV